MARQLVLLDSTGADWRLDDATRASGKRGIALARAALGTPPRGAQGDDSHQPAA